MQTLGKLFVSCVFVLSATIVQAGDLAKPYQLLAGDEPIDIGGIGYAAPFVGDFDSGEIHRFGGADGVFVHTSK